LSNVNLINNWDESIQASEELIYKVVSSMESYPGIWARTNELSKVYKNIDNFITSIVIFKSLILCVTPGKLTYTVTKVNR